MRVGVMIVGLRGATASTLVATTLARRPGDAARFLLTEQPGPKALDLPGLDELFFGGWDCLEETWQQTLDRHGVLDYAALGDHRRALEAVPSYPAIALPEDHAVVSGEAGAARGTGLELLDRLRLQIREHRSKVGAERMVLVYLGAPPRLPPADSWPQTEIELLSVLEKGGFSSAAPYYVAAAILEGAAIIDYTASATLEIPGLMALASTHRCPVAGRDGSTGQTLLKSVLAEMFVTRRLKVRGWYSTNILGNHDGLVLGDERYADVKKIDKTALLEIILGEPVESHLVDIRHYLPAGDEKEAWDAIDFETWHGGRGSMRIDWRAGDSFLATPPLIDLIRCSAALIGKRRGLVPELGVFFKHPLGTPERRYLHLARSFRSLLSST